MNGLGEILQEQAEKHDRVVDLFCGAASVAWHAATKCRKPVLACDLQTFATILASAVISRTKALDAAKLEKDWLGEAESSATRSSVWKSAEQYAGGGLNTATWVARARELCSDIDHTGVVWTAYGGHYFSPRQALCFDNMLKKLPIKEPSRTVCLAATIIAASQCAAAPGHTAQPFRPSRTAALFIRDAWNRDPFNYARKALEKICPMHAAKAGHARAENAIDMAGKLSETDLAFVDPPYSGVHYSRFYHVLETIARQECGPVSGVGRYPPPDERPTSAFSRQSESCGALKSLLQNLATSSCTTVFTFPAGECSNGLSGAKVREIATEWFTIQQTIVKSRFSTLGGNGDTRLARHKSKEMILVLRPRTTQG